MSAEPEQASLYPSGTMRDELRELIYGAKAGSFKEIAMGLFGDEKVGNSYSRLTHALQPKVPEVPSNNFDCDWILPALQHLPPKSRLRFAAWLLQALDVEAIAEGKLAIKNRATPEERLARLESKLGEIAKLQAEANSEMREMREDDR